MKSKTTEEMIQLYKKMISDATRNLQRSALPDYDKAELNMKIDIFSKGIKRLEKEALQPRIETVDIAAELEKLRILAKQEQESIPVII
ncbi:hypothetical protein [Risungbinella massiliensis]|uniref:hypothetical protein n=1 Tax=Risungbinella massiliensis TaxID=1329796 RepID=UPI0005CC41A1|nr:hypothetical protein [Risungbinella massiliensis]